MVKETSVFAALADPTRRSLLLNLAENRPKTASELAREYPISRQGLIKHLNILDEAGFVSVFEEGRKKRYALSLQPLTELEQFIQELNAKWDQRLLRLKAMFEEE
jgi:DNA-binding transcriptional ArsR family regulator